MVVLAGYKTVKEALVTYADDFGERDPMLIAEETNHGHGKKRIKRANRALCKGLHYLPIISLLI